MNDQAWYVYIVRCADLTLYTGVATDLGARIEKHNNGRGAKYTRGRRPVELVYQERVENRSAALRREIVIKRMEPSAKLKLVATNVG